MIIKTCAICKNNFFTYPSRKQRRKTCSKICSKKYLGNYLKKHRNKGMFKKGNVPYNKLKKQPEMSGQNNPMWKGGKSKFKCIDCGFVITAYKKVKRCRNCFFETNKGDKHPNWKGGCLNRRGYVYLLNPDHKTSDSMGYIFEHRLVAEKFLGRYLTRKEIIHHINGKKNDNRPENLYLCSSNSEHRKLHKKGIKISSNLF